MIFTEYEWKDIGLFVLIGLLGIVYMLIRTLGLLFVLGLIIFGYFVLYLS